ncbi:MAG: Ig-like domain-containing protein [Pseudoflavonifractor sp.]|nr:Ig-like domain-containing protein [Alloprevotella sp.]MCM1116823.1 Ig-like domain-containing protein [Pseudoflavonifractor sp.]
MKLLYYSRLEDIKYDEKALKLASADDEYTLKLDEFIEDVDLDKLTWSLVGQGKTATVATPVVNKINNTITITVTNANGKDVDGLSKHTYTIKCKEPEIAEITIGGDGVTIPTDSYDIIFDSYYTDETKVDAVVKGPATKKITVNDDAATVTVTFTRNDGKTDDIPVYTIRFWKPVTTVEFPDGIAKTLMTDGDPLTINMSTLTISPDDAHAMDKLVVEVYKEDGSEMGADFSDETNVVEIAQTGEVYTLTGRHPGRFTVKVHHPDFPDHTFAEHTVTVDATPVTSIKIKEGKEAVSMLKGYSKTLNVAEVIEFVPSNAYDKGINWTVPDHNAVAATAQDKSSITIKAFTETSEGETVNIRATSMANPYEYVEFAFTVGSAPVAPERILWDDQNLIHDKKYYIGETGDKRLTYHFSNPGVNITPIESWSSVPEGYVDQNGNIIVEEGTDPVEMVTVTLSINWADNVGDPITRNYTFEVRQPVTGLKWVDAKGNEVKSLDFKQHETPSVTAVIEPANASDQTITYESSDESVVKYDEESQTLVASSFGRATITARATNDATDSNGRRPVEAILEVNIAAMPTDITIKGQDKYWVGKSYQLTTEILPIDAATARLSWESSAPDVAEVDDKGLVVIKKEGSATITATAENGENDTLDILAEKYVGTERPVGGWFVITDAEGNKETVKTTIKTLTTSPSDITLTVEDLKVKGFRLGDVSASFEYRSEMAGKDGHPLDINFLPYAVSTTMMKGALSAEVTPSGVSDGVSMGYINFSENGVDATADIVFDITVPDWDNERATAIFTSVKPDDVKDPDPVVPDDPVTPVTPAGTITKYPGKIVFSITPEEGSEPVENPESYQLKVMVTVTDKGEKGSDENGNEVSLVTIEIPELHFGEVTYDDWSRSDDETEYLYNYPAFSLTDVQVKTTGTLTTYIRPEGPVTIEDENGNTMEYTVGLRGTATEQGDARFSLSIFDPFTGETMGGSFANSEDEGDIYSGQLSIEMMGQQLADGQDATINIIPGSDGMTATFILPNLTLEGLGSLGDIKVENVEVDRQDDGSAYYYGSVQGMHLSMNGIDIFADVNLNGFIDSEGIADMTIAVVWEGIDINVKFTGKLTASNGPTTGVSSITVTPTVSDATYDLMGRRLQRITKPGLYIINGRKTIVR